MPYWALLDFQPSCRASLWVVSDAAGKEIPANEVNPWALLYGLADAYTGPVG